MWKAYEQSRVCPFLVGIAAGPTDVKPPLGLFQACDSTNDDEVFRMLKSINLSASESDRLSEVSLERSFKKWLPDLRERLSKIAANETVPAEHRRTQEDVLAEILETVRALARISDAYSLPRWAAELLDATGATGTPGQEASVVLGASPFAREAVYRLAKQRAEAEALRAIGRNAKKKKKE